MQLYWEPDPLIQQGTGATYDLAYREVQVSQSFGVPELVPTGPFALELIVMVSLEILTINSMLAMRHWLNSV